MRRVLVASMLLAPLIGTSCSGADDTVYCSRAESEFVGVRIVPTNESWMYLPGLPPDHPDYDVSQEYGPSEGLSLSDIPCERGAAIDDQAFVVDCEMPDESDGPLVLNVESYGFPASELDLPQSFLFEVEAHLHEGPRVYRFYANDGTTLLASAEPNEPRNLYSFGPQFTLGPETTAWPELAFCSQPDSGPATLLSHPPDRGPCNAYMVTRFEGPEHETLWDGHAADVSGFKIMGQAFNRSEAGCVVGGWWSAARF